MRVGSKKGNFPLKDIKEQHGHGHKGSWRKMLFNRVQSPYAKDTIFGWYIICSKIECHYKL